MGPRSAIKMKDEKKNSFSDFLSADFCYTNNTLSSLLRSCLNSFCGLFSQLFVSVPRQWGSISSYWSYGEIFGGLFVASLAILLSFMLTFRYYFCCLLLLLLLQLLTWLCQLLSTLTARRPANFIVRIENLVKPLSPAMHTYFESFDFYIRNVKLLFRNRNIFPKKQKKNTKNNSQGPPAYVIDV